MAVIALKTAGKEIFIAGRFPINFCLNRSNIAQEWKDNEVVRMERQTDILIIFHYFPLPLLPSADTLTHYHTMPHFDALKIYSLKNIVRNKQFLLSHNVFHPIWHLFFIFKCTLKMLSAICFNLERSTILTLSHTIPTFNDPKEEAFGKHCGKRRKW